MLLKTNCKNIRYLNQENTVSEHLHKGFRFPAFSAFIITEVLPTSMDLQEQVRDWDWMSEKQNEVAIGWFTHLSNFILGVVESQQFLYGIVF